MNTVTTYTGNTKNVWLSAMMALVVVGLIGRGFYSLHYSNGEGYSLRISA
jgi:hypothetical protein